MLCFGSEKPDLFKIESLLYTHNGTLWKVAEQTELKAAYIVMQKKLEDLLLRLNQIVSSTRDNRQLKSFLEACIRKIETAVHSIPQLQDREQYIQCTSTTSLQKTNKILFRELDPLHYSESYLNPLYSISRLGEARGYELSYFFFLLILALRSVYRDRAEDLFGIVKLLIRFFESSEHCFEKHIKRCLRDFLMEKRYRTYRDNFQDSYTETNPAVQFILDKQRERKALFVTGYYIEEQTLALFDFLNDYDCNKLSELAEVISSSFIDSFSKNGKNLELPSVVRIVYYPGFDPFYTQLSIAFTQYNIKPLFAPAFTSCFEEERLSTDHNNDFFSYLDEQFGNYDIYSFRKCCEEFSTQLYLFSGFVDFMFLGKDSSADFASRRLNRDQQNRQLEINRKKITILKKHCPERKTNFCYAPLAVPALGSDFRSIFNELLALSIEDDAERVCRQQLLIDEIDEAEFVYLKGKAPNKTDIRFRLHPLNDETLYTNFTNCGKGQNIPAGEIFTTPLLAGTSGTIHLDRFPFRGHTFIDLTMHFENGFIDTYSCANYETDEDNSHFIETLLFSGHSSLPVGEFAIGTNTRAYSIIRRYNIADTVPSLLLEKTAPHLAIGDSCYARRRGSIKNSANGKTLSLLNNQKRLFNTHVDITLPFENIEILEASFADGKRVPIVYEGIFVPKYLSQLNKYLKRY